MGEQFNQAVSLKELGKSIRKGRRSNPNKAVAVEWDLRRYTKAKGLRDDLLSGRYRMRKGYPVHIYRPKPRMAIAPWFRDQVWQRSMCENGLYTDLTRSAIYHNMACQKGKGTDLAIRRIVKMLQTLHREGGEEPVRGIHLDIHKYFPSTPHRAVLALDEERVNEPLFLPYVTELATSLEDPRSSEEVEADPFGPRGTGLGSQINQINQVMLPDRLDHEIIRLGVKYLRYNDDFLILSRDREALRQAVELVRERAKATGLTVTDKAGVFQAVRGFTFIGKRFILTETGKVVIRLRRGAMQEERRTLRMLKGDLDAGRCSWEHIRAHYQSWAANAEYAGDAPIRAMDKFYTQLFREKPRYKRCRRYLYGDRKKHKKAPARGGA